VLALEVILALYKLVVGQWTYRLAVFNLNVQVVTTIVFVVIIIDPNLLNSAFTTTITDLLDFPSGWGKWLIGSSLFLVVVFAILEVFQGFRRASIKYNTK